jgi:hypothetical protein
MTAQARRSWAWSWGMGPRPLRSTPWLVLAMSGLAEAWDGRIELLRGERPPGQFTRAGSAHGHGQREEVKRSGALDLQEEAPGALLG